MGFLFCSFYGKKYRNYDYFDVLPSPFGVFILFILEYFDKYQELKEKSYRPLLEFFVHLECGQA